MIVFPDILNNRYVCSGDLNTVMFRENPKCINPNTDQSYCQLYSVSIYNECNPRSGPSNCQICKLESNQPLPGNTAKCYADSKGEITNGKPCNGGICQNGACKKMIIPNPNPTPSPTPNPYPGSMPKV
jgi:hypothetical protein